MSEEVRECMSEHEEEIVDEETGEVLDEDDVVRWFDEGSDFPLTDESTLIDEQVRRVGYYYHERDEIEAMRNSAIDRLKTEHAMAILEINGRADRMLRPILSRIAWYESGLFGFLGRYGKSLWKGMYGQISKRQGRIGAKLDGETGEELKESTEKAIAYIRAQKLVDCLRPTLALTGCKNYIEQGGEIPGMDLRRGDPSFGIKINEACK